MDRSHYPFLAQSDTIHLDASAAFPLHERVIGAVDQAMRQTLGTPGKASYSSSEKVMKRTNRIRQEVADFIGADVSEVFFTASATDAIKFIVDAWASNSSLLYSPEDHSRIIAEIKHKSTNSHTISCRADGEYDYDQINNSSIDVAFISSLHHVYGSYNHIEKIRQLLPSTRLVVDVSQSISREPTNVKKGDIDALFFSSQKVGGIAGVGVLYIAKKHHNTLDLSRLEPNTIPFIPLVSLNEALSILKEEDLAKTSLHLAKVTTSLIEGLQQNQNVVFSKGPAYPEYRCYGSGILSFSINGYTSQDIAMILDEQGIQVRAGDHCLDPNAADQDVIRISVHSFNSSDDVEQSIHAIKKL